MNSLFKALTVAAFGLGMTAPAGAAEISTHVLDLARGVGGAGVPVTLTRQHAGGRWIVAGRGVTDGNGRIRTLADPRGLGAGLYRLRFDMSRYPQLGGGQPFFPEIEVAFRVDDPRGHYHVPVVMSPYGYSTYRGN